MWGTGALARMRGRGEPGAPGQLEVTVTVSPYPVFGRTGSDLTLVVPVTFPEASPGATILARCWVRRSR